ncbi:hypothetical protein [Solimicrobium silvestre]|uniref:Uncharacterized protein n=1 Tax=Solimicrobium silvestre TaxID=2099400 RepID=A0A2S9H573_9BURK|nr:hypothetical protein [Solimicrobium silvestre]PRC95134.1 hypothetical protein S2091_0329 [Solimicrobium silvestre]
MSTYLPALIWLLSAFACMFIAKRRHVKPTAIWAMVVTVLGPIAIPLVFFAKPEKYART